MKSNSKIYMAGHRGLVGSAILENLRNSGYNNILIRTHAELDLTNQNAVANFFEQEKPEYVILAAAKVGGIVANNTYRADFIYENLMIQNNVIHQSFLNGVKKLLFLGSTCIYPKNCAQPMKEEYLLTDELEYTNEPYAVAKIAGIKMCESYNIQYGTNFIAVQPTNLYGPNDNFDLEKSHVLPAILRKLHLAKSIETHDWDTIRKDFNSMPIGGVSGESEESEITNVLNKFGIRANGSSVSVELWGSGKPYREFLWSADMADACVHLLENVDFQSIVESNHLDKLKEIKNTHINIGTGREISIKELAFMIKEIVGFKGDILFDSSKPDGTIRKLTDTSKLNELGWNYSVELKDGIKRMYEWYLASDR